IMVRPQLVLVELFLEAILNEQPPLLLEGFVLGIGPQRLIHLPLFAGELPQADLAIALAEAEAVCLFVSLVKDFQRAVFLFLPLGLEQCFNETIDLARFIRIGLVLGFGIADEASDVVFVSDALILVEQIALALLV